MSVYAYVTTNNWAHSSKFPKVSDESITFMERLEEFYKKTEEEEKQGKDDVTKAMKELIENQRKMVAPTVPKKKSIIVIPSNDEILKVCKQHFDKKIQNKLR